MNRKDILDTAKILKEDNQQYDSLLKQGYWILSYPYFSQSIMHGGVTCEAQGVKFYKNFICNMRFEWSFLELQNGKYKSKYMTDLDFTQKPEVFPSLTATIYDLKDPVDCNTFCCYGAGLIIKKKYFNPYYDST